MKKITGNTSRFLLGVTILLAVMGISDSCTKKTASDMYGTTVGTKGTDGPGTNQVWIQDMAYNPATINVSAGTTITWLIKYLWPTQLLVPQVFSTADQLIQMVHTLIYSILQVHTLTIVLYTLI